MVRPGRDLDVLQLWGKAGLRRLLRGLRARPGASLSIGPTLPIKRNRHLPPPEKHLICVWFCTSLDWNSISKSIDWNFCTFCDYCCLHNSQQNGTSLFASFFLIEGKERIPVTISFGGLNIKKMSGNTPIVSHCFVFQSVIALS